MKRGSPPLTTPPQLNATITLSFPAKAGNSYLINNQNNRKRKHNYVVLRTTAGSCLPSPCVSSRTCFRNSNATWRSDSISRTFFIQLQSAKLISVSIVCQDIFPKNLTDYSASVRIIIRFFGALLDRLSHFAFCGRHTVEERIFFMRAIAQMFNFLKIFQL